uniref:Uncharacterized protein TCIL3000_3_3470 n=1 Tax=Trypanosoma congolense (strain IL3000) TaxID=1068625 RepID=G0UKK7_TRYCI|nr:unnamed protein product [Trypanosoma congolense IL3000]
MTNKKIPVPIGVLSEDPKKKDNEKRNRDAESLKMSEEDERINSQVELLVTRTGDSNTDIALVAVEQLIDLLRTNTSGSVASVPKPLKYIRPMYAQLEKTQKETTNSTLASLLHDVLSFVAMTLEFPDGQRPALDHKLKGTQDDLARWGHEYLLYLSGCVGAEWKERVSKGECVKHLTGFVQQIVDYMVKHQDESAAVDLLMEIEDIRGIIPFVDSHNHRRIASYLAASRRYLTRPLDTEALRVIYDIYVEMESYTEALFVALQLGDREAVESLFEKCQRPSVKLQMALSCARYRLFLSNDNDEERLLSDANGNMRLSQLYRHVAQELDSMTPLGPEEIFKISLDGKQSRGSTGSNFKLACSLASGLVNCGFGKDTYLTHEDAAWFNEQADDRLFTSTAMLGLIHLWDHEEGLLEIHKYINSETTNIKAGACLAFGIAQCGIYNSFNAALQTLSEVLKSRSTQKKEVTIGAILGLGYSYAGTMHNEVKETLIPILEDDDQVVDVHCITAFALSMVFAGSPDEEIVESLMSCLIRMSEEDLSEPMVCYLVLALGCLFLGKQEAADNLLIAVQVLPPIIRRYAQVVIRGCAYAATGNVVVIQDFFHTIAENDEPEETEGTKANAEKNAQQAQKKDAKKRNGPRHNPNYGERRVHLNHKAAAVLGIGLVALGEEIGTEMAKRSIIHTLLVDTVAKGDKIISGRHAIPLAYALLSASNPSMQVVETLNRLSHDSDTLTAVNAVVAMGLVAAGSSNARVMSRLRNLATYYQRDGFASQLFSARLAQGFAMMGRGHLTLTPLLNDHSLVSPTALVGLLGFLHGAMNFENIILDRHSYMVSCIVPSISPRMVLAVDADMEVIKEGVQVRVGQPVDTVAVAGKPKTITGFQTQTTPTLLSATDKVEVASQKYRPVAVVVEGIFVVEEKPSVE